MAKEPTVKLKIELPDHERGRSPEDVRRFDKLQNEIKNRAVLQLTDEQVEIRRQQIAEIEARTRVEADKAWIGQATEERQALATLRGEDLGERDGLMSLLRFQCISPEDYDLAMEIRACYEARSSDVGSQLGNISPGAAHNNDRYVMARAKRARRLWALGKTEIAVALECKDEPACLQMLRAVVGEGVVLSAFGRGRAFQRHLAALLRAVRIYERIRDTGR